MGVTGIRKRGAIGGIPAGVEAVGPRHGQGCWGRDWGVGFKLSKEPLAGALKAADAAQVLNHSSAL